LTLSLLRPVSLLLLRFAIDLRGPTRVGGVHSVLVGEDRFRSH
jgi:hypothetical protein